MGDHRHHITHTTTDWTISKSDSDNDDEAVQARGRSKRIEASPPSQVSATRDVGVLRKPRRDAGRARTVVGGGGGSAQECGREQENVRRSLDRRHLLTLVDPTGRHRPYCRTPEASGGSARRSAESPPAPHACYGRKHFSPACAGVMCGVRS
jgi:hypothetical protein